MLPIEAPEWEPLLDLAAQHVDDFMWMFAVELADGTRLQAYKHCWTRNYLFLDGNGRAFVNVESERYEEVNAGWFLARVLNEDLASKDRYNFVGHNDPEELQISWARSATKHRISRQRSEHVVRRCGLRFSARERHGSLAWEDDRVLFLGDDTDGVALEVVAVEVGEEAFLVIHAMKLRDRYLGLYERARRWRR